MFHESVISGIKFKLATDLAAADWQAWNHKSPASKTVRLIGVLGEMAAAEYLTSIAGRRTCVPQGLTQRMGLTGEVALDRGDILLIGKRNIKRGPDYRDYTVDSVQAFEVKATTTAERRGMIEVSAAQDYAKFRVSGVVLVSIAMHGDSATCVVEDVADPLDIVESWPVVQVEDRTFYQSPTVIRKIAYNQ